MGELFEEGGADRRDAARGQMLGMMLSPGRGRRREVRAEDRNFVQEGRDQWLLSHQNEKFLFHFFHHLNRIDLGLSPAWFRDGPDLNSLCS